jgi:hypothetical protein
VYLVDWQCYGVDAPSTELAYFLNTSVTFQPERERKLIRAYYEEFVRSLAESDTVCPPDYTLGKLEREVAVRNVSLCATSLSLLMLDTPENRRKREFANPKMITLNRAMNSRLENLFERGRWNLDHSFSAQSE